MSFDEKKWIKYAVIAFFVWAVFHVIKTRTKNETQPDPMAGGEF